MEENTEAESNMVIHARRELQLLGEDQETIDGYLKVIKAWGDMEHSGGSASIGYGVLMRLLQYKNIKPLTDNPDEWIFHNKTKYGVSEDVWQSKRNFEAFSVDGGKTYWLLSEVKHRRWPFGLRRTIRKAVSHV